MADHPDTERPACESLNCVTMGTGGVGVAPGKWAMGTRSSKGVGRRTLLTGMAGGTLASAVGPVAQVPRPGRQMTHLPPPGIVGDGIADDTAAIQAALDAGGLVHLPAGRYRLTAPLRPRSGTALVGDGSASVLLPEGSRPAIADVFTSASPLTEFHCRDFAIDGRNQTGPYTSASKGIFITHLSGCTFVNLLVTNTAATGIGIDYLYDGTVVRDCRLFGCGRLNGGTQPGGAGIGIGTGARPLESFVVEGNHCAGNARFGIFVESQTTLASSGGRLVANTCEANRHGIGDAGMAGLIVLGNVCVANSGTGIVVNTGTLSPIVGRDGHVAGNVCNGNGEFGILFDTSVAPAGQSYTFRGNRCDRNAKAGIKIVSNGSRVIAGVVVTDNDVNSNGSLGIHVMSTGARATDLTITGNRLASNGQSNTAGFTQAIRIDTNTDRFTIANNVCWDAGSPKRQTHGVQLSAGATFTDGHIRGNHVTGNAAGGLNLAGRLLFCVVDDNPGDVVPAPRVTTPGPSPWTYAAGPSPETVYLSGGAITSIVTAGVAVATTAPVITLRPNQQVTIAYDSAPRVVVDRL